MWKLIITALVVIGVTQIGCKRDDDDDETPPPPPPDMLFLDSLIIEQMPFVDESGAGWDVSTGPDVFFRLLQGSSVVTTSPSLDNVAPSHLPIGWVASPPLEIPIWTTDLVVDLWDYDDLVDDYIGSVVFDFETQSQLNGYVNRYTVSNAAQTIRVRVAVHWYWE